jgi:ion channel-forming bestrophin family protein
MHAGRRFTLKEVVYWTRRDIYIIAFLSFIPTAFYYFFDIKWLVIPWVAIGLVGTAAAFVVGFKNTQTYNRLWEARQIYGAIINSSRTLGIMVIDALPKNDPEIKTIIYRHFAWLTALRFQLREPRIWENMQLKSNAEYHRIYDVPEHIQTLDKELDLYLSETEKNYVLTKKNRATHILAKQSHELKRLWDEGKISELTFIEFGKLFSAFYDHQGKAERIKNFPYPRQFATINQMFVRLFMVLLPFGILQEFGKMSKDLGEIFIWATVPCSLIVSWVFYLMERIGESTENPFEGGANDVPISNISRMIEIDLREMLDEQNIPPATTPQNNILM